MLNKFPNSKNIWFVVKVISIVILSIALILTVFSYFDISFSIKVTLTLITSVLAIIEISHSYKESDKSFFRTKRSWMVLLAILWFIFTVWDNYEEESKELIQARKADSLSKVAEKRTKKIIRDITTSLGKIEESGRGINHLDSVLLKVKDTLEDQVDLLKTAVGKSKEIYDLEDKKLRLDNPEITVLSAEVKFVTSSKDSLKYGVNLNFINYKKRPASNWKYSTCLIVYNAENTRKNIRLGGDGLWSEAETLIGGGSVKHFAEIYFDLNKKSFKKDYGFAILVIRAKYSDDYNDSDFDDNTFLTCRYSINKEVQFYKSGKNEKRFAISYLEDLKLSDYLSSQ